MLLVVYGTLREGEALSSLLDFVRSRSEIEITTVPIELYVVGQCPGARLPDPKTHAKMVEPGTNIQWVTVELWDMHISKKEEKYILNYLDEVEGVSQGLYLRREVATKKGKAWIYVYTRTIGGCPRIYDWKEWQSRPFEERSKAFEKIVKATGTMEALGGVSSKL